MATTLLNPTVWLLAATIVVSLVGVYRGRSAADSLWMLLRVARTPIVLVALLAMAAVGLGSRLIVAPGVERARTGGQAGAIARFNRAPPSASDTRAGFADWLAVAKQRDVPWKPLPGSQGCPAVSMADRVPLFTTHGDTPPFLALQAYAVRYFGQGVSLLTMKLVWLAAALTIVARVLRAYGLKWRSREGLLVAAAVAGWQPVLAGIRQLDAALPATALVMVAWHAARTRRLNTSAAAAACAACCALPALGGVIGVARLGRRAALTVAGVLAVLLGATAAITGWHVLVGFVLTVVYAAKMWLPVGISYSLSGRIASAEAGTVLFFIALAAGALISWWRARGADGSFASFVTLGLLAAPVVFSAQLSLALIALVVVFARMREEGSSRLLLAWALLALSLSLPDQAARWTTWPLLSPAPGSLPLGVFGLIALWLWSLRLAPAVPARNAALAA